jgi:hypothetical protein
VDEVFVDYIFNFPGLSYYVVTVLDTIETAPSHPDFLFHAHKHVGLNQPTFVLGLLLTYVEVLLKLLWKIIYIVGGRVIFNVIVLIMAKMS